MKKTVLHIIHNLGRGGAETMLVKVVKELKDYNNIVVTLFPMNHFGDELKCDKLICLDLRSILQIPFATSRLKKIIRENNVDIVHSHLFWPTVMARMATPKNIPLVTTIHAFIATSVEYKIGYIRWIDRWSYNLRNSTIVTVAKGALDEYFSFLKLKRHKAYALHTFADTKVFNVNNIKPPATNGVFRMVSVGALRKQKNHEFLIRAFRHLDNKKYRLDIYGAGPLHDDLQEMINTSGLNIHLMGEIRNIEERLPAYDLFVMSSTFEGFSLGVLEAMAMKKPLLLSDISSFREQCEDIAVYFELNDVDTFTKKLEQIANGKEQRLQMAEAGYNRVMNNFTLQHHMEGLRKIYSDELSSDQHP